LASSAPSEKLLKTIRDYAEAEPSFTAAFAAWDLSTNHGYKITGSGVRNAMDVLEEQGQIKLIEDGGRMGRVYAYAPPKPVRHIAPIEPRVSLPELDAGLGIGSAAPKRGEVVPHTRTEGPSGRPGRDRKRQERGIRVKRQRQGT
jgi:hypothetical protein